jgi:sugar transferase (PEP-CTERM system associated)
MIRLFNVYFPSRTLFLAISEAMLIFGLLLVAILLRFGGDFELAILYEQGLIKVAVASSVLILCMYYYDLYDSLIFHRPVEVLARLIQVLGTASVLLSCLYYAFPEVQLARGPFVIWIGLIGLALLGWRRLFFLLNRSQRMAERTVLLGAGRIAGTLSSEIDNRPELGLSLVGYMDAPSANSVEGLRYLGIPEELPRLVEGGNISRVILTMTDRRGRLPVDMLLDLKGRGLVVQDGPDVYEAVTGRVCLDTLRPSWLLFSDGFRISRFVLFYKRVASIVLSLIGIILTAPLLVLIAIAIRLDSPGPAIFRQERIGLRGKIFTIFKFRTMWVNADADGVPRAATEKDNRVTRVGRWLRRLRIDELPQFFNILRGDMYFIGPRPFTPNMEAELSQQIPLYSQRWVVKPGATGWAQIRRGYCTTLEDNIDKLSYDLFYIKNLSLGLDCLVLFETIKILLLGRGGR